MHFEIKTYSASGGAAPRPLHLGSTTSGNPLSEFLDPPLPSSLVNVYQRKLLHLVAMH